MATGLTIGTRHLYTISGYCRRIEKQSNFSICNLVQQCILEHYDDSERFDCRHYDDSVSKDIQCINNVFKVLKHPQIVSPISIFGEVKLHKDTDKNYEWIFNFSSEFRYDIGVIDSQNPNIKEDIIMWGSFRDYVVVEGKYFKKSMVQKKIWINFRGKTAKFLRMGIGDEGYFKMFVAKDDNTKYNLGIHITAYHNARTKDILEYVSSKYVDKPKYNNSNNNNNNNNK